MTNFEKYKEKLNKKQFIQSMILNCDGCPVYPCGLEDIVDGGECEEKLEEWCDEYVGT